VLVPFGAWQQHLSAVSAASPLPDDVGQDACAIWFVGSSSMRNWNDIQTDMAPWTTHDRSIGGASLVELTSRFGNGRNPHPPQAIVFYAGENDLAYGVPAAKVTQEFVAFLKLKRKRMGSVPLIFVSVKPSPTRWANFAEQSAYNAAVAKLAASEPDLSFINTVPQFLDAGKPGNFYLEDGIHLSPAGYQIWGRAVRGHVRDALPPRVVGRCDRSL
jgi:lysophospholipase L1-like esterase